jgi:hypothetical protein
VLRDAFLIIASRLVIGTCAQWSSRGRGIARSPRGFALLWAALVPAAAGFGQPTETDRVAAAFGRLSLEYTLIGESDVRAAWGEAIDRRTGELELSEAQEAALGEALSREMLARAESAEAYLQHADETETARWLSPEDEREWVLVEMFKQGTLDPEPSERDDARAALEHAASRSFERSGPVRAWAADARGTEVVVYEAASFEAFHKQAASRHHEDLLDMAFAGGGSSRGVVCRLPEPDVRSLIERDGAATAASALALVRTGDGEVMGWWSSWAWDAMAEAWVCQAMARTGPGKQLMYY